MIDFSKFDPEQVKNAINLGMYKAPYPGVTREFVRDALIWFFSEEGQQYIDEALEYWKNKEEEPEPEPVINKVDFTFVQTKQLNEECGFWFVKTNLRVIHSFGENTYPGGEIFMKKTHGKTGRFRANLSDIPLDAEIQKAYLVMTLERHEGIANGDRESIFEIRNGKDVAVKEVTADWINTNYQKWSNPNVIVDLSDYFKRYR